MIFLEVGKIEGFWRELLLALCKPVYQLIVYMYELFEVIATAEIITSDTLSTIYNRVGLLLGMYMMFRIILSFIQMLINPDIISDKEKGIGNISKKAILVVVLLGITPFVFNKAIELQNYIVGVETKDNVIAKLIFPKEIIGSEKFGAVLSASLFDSFYRYDDDYNPDTDDNECYIKPYGEADGGTLYSHIINTNGNINAAKACLDNTWVPGRGEDARYSISFTQNGLFALIVGLVVCYMLLSYTLMVGARVIQLAFLRLVAPMAILGYLSPKKDGMFEKWLKMCVTTYIDLFIRMAILFFIVFMIDAIIGGDNGISLVKDFDHMWMVNVVMILALLIFGKKAPELLKELFPSTGGAASLGYGLKSPKKMLDSMAGGQKLWNGTKRAAGFGLGALAGGVIGFAGGRGWKGRTSGVFGGIGRGAFNGAKKGGLWSNLKGVGTKQAQVNKQKIDWQNNNSTWRGRMSQRMANAFGTVGAAEGFENQMAEYDKELNNLNARASAYKEASGSVGKMEDRATSQLDTKTFKPSQIYQKSLQQRRRNYKAISEALANGDYVTAQSLVNTEKERIQKIRNDWATNQSEYSTVSSEYNDLKNRGITSGAHFEAVEARYKELDSLKKAYDVSMDPANDDLKKIDKISSALNNEIKIVKINEQKEKAETRLNELKTKLYSSSEGLTPEESKEAKYLNDVIKSSNTEIEKLSENERYTAAQANEDMTDVFTETRNEYITVSLQDEFGDAVVKSEYKHVQDVVNHPDNQEAFRNFKNSSEGNTYKAMDDFATEAKTANTELSSNIYRAQTAKETISKSEAKKAADADRSAVGGHSGGKK